MAIELGSGYVVVSGNTAQLGKDIASGFGGSEKIAQDAGAKAGGKFGGAVSGSVAGLLGGASVAGIAAGFLAIGNTFDEVSDGIRTNTGKTGAALDGLVDSTKTVGRGVTQNFEQVGGVISDLNVKLGLTGKPLEGLATQFLNLSRVTGTDVKTNMDAVTRAFGDWGIKSQDQSKTLDFLFKASQQTGVGVDKLSQSVVQFGAPMRAMGFSMEQTTALLGTFQQKGVNANLVMGSMRIALGKMAKAGEDAPTTLRRTITEIQNMPDATQAAAKAIELFGQRAGPDMADTIRGGKFNIDQLVDSIAKSPDTINKAAEDTADFAETWAKFKNNVLADLEPIATRVFSAMSTGAAFLSDHATTAGIVLGGLAAIIGGVLMVNVIRWGVESTIAAAKSVAGFATSVAAGASSVIAFGIQAATVVAGWVVMGVQSMINAARMAASWLIALGPIGLLIGAIAAIIGVFVLLWAKCDWFRNFWIGLWNNIVSVAQTMYTAVLKPIFDAFIFAMQAVGNAAMWLWNSAIVPAWNGIGAVIGWVYNNLLRPIWIALEADWQFLGQAMSFLWNNVISPVWNALGAGIRWVYDNVLHPIWEGLKADWRAMQDAFAFMWNGVINPIWSALGNGIKWVVDNIISPAWEGMKKGLKAVGDFFGTVVSGIAAAWDGVRKAVAVPINFVIETVWNNGLLKAWNAVAGFLPGLHPAAPLTRVPFAQGGAVGGARRGVDSVDAVLMPNEHVWDVEAVAKSGGQNVMYAMRNLIKRGIPFSWDAVKGLEGANPNVVKALATAPEGADMAGLLHGANIPGFKDGGAVPAAWELQLAEGHKFAQSKNGHPYTWGNEDCSGYMSMIADKILGGPGQRRWATSSFPGGQPWQPGLGPGFSVGVHDDPGGPGGGHTAGTLGPAPGFAAANVESGGSHGNVAYGGPAVGADDPQWNGVSPGRFHLGIGADGSFMSGGVGGGPSPEAQKGWLHNRIREVIDGFMNPVKAIMAKAVPPAPPELYRIPPVALDLTRDGAVRVADGVVDTLGSGLRTVFEGAKHVGSAIAGGVGGAAKSAVGAVTGVFRDTGGYIPNGLTLVRNETGRPEAVLNWQQLEQVRDMMKTGRTLLEAVHATGAKADNADKAQYSLNANDGVGAVESLLFQGKMAGVTAKSTKEFLGSAGKIIGESVFDIFNPFGSSDVGDLFDPVALADRYTLKDSDKKDQTTAAGTNQLTQQAVPQNQQPLSSQATPQTVTPAVPAPAPEQQQAPLGLYTPAAPQTDESPLTSQAVPQQDAPPTAAYTPPTTMDQSNFEVNPQIPESQPVPGGSSGSGDYVGQIADAAKQAGVGLQGAIIGVGTALVEAPGDPLAMYANSNVPESLNYPHDRVGSDGTSVGLFQQQQNGAWGSVADGMNAMKSASMFFNALNGFDWQSMDKGAAAQKVQQSGYPDRYDGKMPQAADLLKDKFDTGGIVRPGISLVENRTGGSEHMGILTNDQWGTLQDVSSMQSVKGGDDYSVQIGTMVAQDTKTISRDISQIQTRRSMKGRGRP